MFASVHRKHNPSFRFFLPRPPGAGGKNEEEGHQARQGATIDPDDTNTFTL